MPRIRQELLKVFNLLIITEVKLRKYLKSDKFTQLTKDNGEPIGAVSTAVKIDPNQPVPTPQAADQATAPAADQATTPAADQATAPAADQAPAPAVAPQAPDSAVAPQAPDSGASSDPEIVDDAAVKAAAPSDAAIDDSKSGAPGLVSA